MKPHWIKVISRKTTGTLHRHGWVIAAHKPGWILLVPASFCEFNKIKVDEKRKDDIVSPVSSNHAAGEKQNTPTKMKLNLTKSLEKEITLYHAQRSVDLPFGGTATENYIAASYEDADYLAFTRRNTARHGAIAIKRVRPEYITDMADGDFCDVSAHCARLGFSL